MSETRVGRPGAAGEQRQRPKHSRQDSDPPPQDQGRPGAPDLQPPTSPPRLGPRDYRLRGLDLGSGSPPAPAPVARTPSAVNRRRIRLRQRRKRWLIMVAAAITFAVLVAVLLRLTLITPFTVPSSAMAPTLQSGDRILVLRASFLTGSIGRGDIIVFHRPKYFPCRTPGRGQYLVQRVIGMPGDIISSDHQTIYIDGKSLAEHGWYDPGPGALSTVEITKTTIPNGDYFVLSDNRTDSCDSRSFGAIPGSSTLGKVVAVIARNGNPYLHLF
jgi:signal peptidase I